MTKNEMYNIMSGNAVKVMDSHDTFHKGTIKITRSTIEFTSDTLVKSYNKKDLVIDGNLKMLCEYTGDIIGAVGVEQHETTVDDKHYDVNNYIADGKKLATDTADDMSKSHKGSKMFEEFHKNIKSISHNFDLVKTCRPRYAKIVSFYFAYNLSKKTKKYLYQANEVIDSLHDSLMLANKNITLDISDKASIKLVNSCEDDYKSAQAEVNYLIKYSNWVKNGRDTDLTPKRPDVLSELNKAMEENITKSQVNVIESRLDLQTYIQSALLKSTWSPIIHDSEALRNILMNAIAEFKTTRDANK